MYDTPRWHVKKKGGGAKTEILVAIPGRLFAFGATVLSQLLGQNEKTPNNKQKLRVIVTKSAPIS